MTEHPPEEPAVPGPRAEDVEGTDHPAQPSSPPPSGIPSGLSPLPGEAGIPDLEPPPAPALSRKGLFAVGLLVTSLLVVSGTTLHRLCQGGLMGGRNGGAAGPLPRDQPAAAGASPRRLELSAPATSTSLESVDRGARAPATAPVVPARIPALVATGDELAEPIPVRRTGPAGPTTGSPPAITPQDAPVMLVSTRPAPAGTASPAGPSAARHTTDTRPGQAMAESLLMEAAPDEPSEALRASARHLEAYQRRLQGLMDQMDQMEHTQQTTQSAAPDRAAGPDRASPSGRGLTASPAAAPSPLTARPMTGGGLSDGASSGLFAGQLQASSTPRVAATTLGQRSLVLPQGSSFTCALKTRVISAASGLVTCQVQRNVYGDDGRVLLIERGAHLDGEYRLAAVRAGMVRIPVLWTRLRTPLGVTVDLESPATGPLGESGIGGEVDQRWRERLGAALLLSLIDDSVKLVIQNQAAARDGGTLVLPSTTANTSKLAEKVLDSTINIPPLIYQHQGGIAAILVARDLDFSTVYRLEPSPTDPPGPARPPSSADAP